jgi:O-antigen/teichoic acid export membrane protein
MTITKNALANGVGRLWSGGLQLGFAPVFLHLLGPQSYGLVTFYTTLTMSLAFLDQAVSPVLTRECARRADRTEDAAGLRDLARSLEIVSYTLGLCIGITVVIFAPYIVDSWLKTGSLPVKTAVAAVRMMGVGLACQWPSFLYQGAYTGLQRQQLLAAIRVIVLTLQYGVALILVIYITRSLPIYFAWQALAFALLTATLGFVLRKILPRSDRPGHFDAHALKTVWRFALGTLGIGVVTTFLTQGDKLLVARYVTLGNLAAYNLSFFIGTLFLLLVVGSLQSAILPYFARLHAQNDELKLASEYRFWTEVVLLLTLPAAGVLIVFPEPILTLWLGSEPDMVRKMLPLVPIVAAGSVFNAVVSLPYMLQLASGWTSLSFIKNVIATILLLPALVVLIPRFGPIAGACSWFALNLGYYLIEVPIMHRRLLKEFMWRWYAVDTGLALLVAGGLFGLARLIYRSDWSLLFSLCYIFAACAITFIALGYALPLVRAAIAKTVQQMRASSRGWSET